jgi:hypothetical protein
MDRGTGWLKVDTGTQLNIDSDARHTTHTTHYWYKGHRTT